MTVYDSEEDEEDEEDEDEEAQKKQEKKGIMSKESVQNVKSQTLACTMLSIGNFLTTHRDRPTPGRRAPRPR
jgi:hypothetical protein